MKTRKEIYQKICEKLQPLVTAGTIKFVDLDKGQLQQPSQSYPIPFPAILIQIKEIEYDHKTDDRVEGNTGITLKVAFNNRHESFIGASKKTDSENMLDLLDTIAGTMAYTRGENFTDMHLSGERFLPYQFKGLHIHDINYTTQTFHQLKTKATVRITTP